MYDSVYASKDYEGECDRLEMVFREAQREVRSVLDLGCGTGNHAIPLARRGYRVCGVDRAPAMLERARRKAAAVGGAELQFVLGDLRTVHLERPFDACILMFATLGYQTTTEDVANALRNVARHLAPGGVLAFDVWNGDVVLAQRPTERARTISEGSRRLIRESSATLDVTRQVCDVRVCQRVIVGGEIVEEVKETHPMRYFFPLELEGFLQAAGFQPLAMTSFDVPEQPLDERSWNMLVVARRR